MRLLAKVVQPGHRAKFTQTPAKNARHIRHWRRSCGGTGEFDTGVSDVHASGGFAGKVIYAVAGGGRAAASGIAENEFGAGADIGRKRARTRLPGAGGGEPALRRARGER